MCRLFHIRAASKYGYGYEILIMKTWHVILILILCLLCFLAGRHTNRIGDELVGKTDTSTLHDTIRDSIPYPVYETVIQTVPEPVSYTHLDVYKRQVIDMSKRLSGNIWQDFVSTKPMFWCEIAALSTTFGACGLAL